MKQHLEKLKLLPWYYQLLMMCGVAALLFGGFWFVAIKSIREERAQLDTQINKLKRENAQAQIAAQNINQIRANYEMRKQQYDELTALLPEQREITNILQGLQDRAKGANLTMMRFTPRDEFEKDFYSGKSVEVEVTSNYTNLRQFYDEMAQYPRIVSITDFYIQNLPEQTSAKTLQSRFLLTAYFATPEKLQNLNPPKKDDGKKKGKKPAPAKEGEAAAN